MTRTEAVLVPLGAMLAGMLVFGIFCGAMGVNPLLVYASIYKAGFGSWYSWQNTLVRAAPLLLVRSLHRDSRARRHYRDRERRRSGRWRPRCHRGRTGNALLSAFRVAHRSWFLRLFFAAEHGLHSASRCSTTAA